MSTKRRLTPGTLSPRRPVPDHILLPPYVVNVNMPPGISSAPQLHDNYGIHCMRASGRLAAQVLQHAATLVMVKEPYVFLIYLATTASPLSPIASHIY